MEEAYRRHRAQVYRFLLRRTRDHHDAEDLAQRVFADAALALARSRPTSTLAWLYAVAERRFVDEARRRRRAATALANLREPVPAESRYGPEAAKVLRRALERLEEGPRAVVVMKLLEGRSFSEIGARIGTSEAAAKMRFSRAIREVRRFLEEEGLEP